MIINSSKFRTFPLEAWQRTREGLGLAGEKTGRLFRVKDAECALNLNEREQVKAGRGG